MAGGPLIIAHRGGAAVRPENTLAAIRHALACGVDGIEVDVHLTAAGHVVVHHDYRLNPDMTRLAGEWLAGPGPLLRDLSLEAIAPLDVGRPRPGSDYQVRHPDLVAVDSEPIPTLEAVIDVLKAEAPKARLFVEMKQEPAVHQGASDEDALAAAIARLIDTTEFRDRAVVMAFAWSALAALAGHDAAIATGFLTYPSYLFKDGPLPEHAPPWADDTRRALRQITTPATPWASGFDPDTEETAVVQAIADLGGAYWCPFHLDATPAAVAAAHANGLKVGVWTVNTRQDVRRLTEAGVDAVTTDYPDILSR